MATSTVLPVRKDLIFNTYLYTVGIIGALLVLWGISQVPLYRPFLPFVLLTALGVVAAFATSTIEIRDSGITYQVGSVAVLAGLAVTGLESAFVIAAVFNFVVWYIKPQSGANWRRSWSQLAFNNGMHAISTLMASIPFVVTLSIVGEYTTWTALLPWLPAAFIYEQVNLWLLICVLRLQHGPEIDVLKLWREDQWATQMGILVLAIGSAALSYGIYQYDLVAAVIFFLPVLMSAYAFRLYIKQTQGYLENLEETVKVRTADLADLNTQKDAYLAVLTHDMMTPLSSIRYCTEMIQDDPTISLEGKQLSELVLRSERTLFTLVQNILDIERIATGQDLIQAKEDHELNQLTKTTLELMEPEADVKELVLSVELTKQPTMVSVDAAKVERVLQNLTSNAIKYTPMGGQINVRTWVTDAFVMVEVSDTGYGIDAEAIRTIFERANRASEIRDKAIGTGLGLAISRSLVEAHGGTLSAESEVGKGSTFTIALPKQG